MVDEQGDTKSEEVRYFARIGKGIRRVPLNWQHPRDPKDGTGYRPLLSRDDFEEQLEDALDDGWAKSRQEFETHCMPDFSGVPQEQMGICAYESTTEGTPISPVYPDTPEGRFQMAKFCAENKTVFAHQKADIEAWAAILFGDDVAHLDIESGRVEIQDSRRDL